MPIRYSITHVQDGRYKITRLDASRKTTSPIYLTRSDLKLYLKDSVSKIQLEQALLTLDSLGNITVEADLES
jgi:hypothetical protein